MLRCKLILLIIRHVIHFLVVRCLTRVESSLCCDNKYLIVQRSFLFFFNRFYSLFTHSVSCFPFSFLIKGISTFYTVLIFHNFFFFCYVILCFIIFQPCMKSDYLFTLFSVLFLWHYFYLCLLVIYKKLYLLFFWMLFLFLCFYPPTKKH